MNKTMLIAATGLLLAPAAMAQTKPQAKAETQQNQPAMHTGQTTQSEQGNTSSTMQASHETMRKQVKSDLQKSGFTDIRVVPDSFIVRAKDKSGNPVMMLINPDSVTEVMASETGGQNQTAGNDPSNDGSGGNQSTFIQVQPGEDMSSKVVGLDVYNNKHQDIGTIKDIAYEGHRIRAYIVGVGGFLGMGDRYVAVSPSALQLSYDQKAKTWHAAMNTTADQLKSAPEVKYPS